MLMVGQLVGIVTFTEDLAGSTPSILRLEKFKFTIKKTQRYLLVSVSYIFLEIKKKKLKFKMDLKMVIIYFSQVSL